MSAEKKLQPEAFYTKLCTLYPDINPVENEDLNIESATINIIRKCWNDRNIYPTVEDIANVTKISPRTIYLYARKNKFKNRKKPANGTVQSY